MARRPDINVYFDLRVSSDGANEYYLAKPVKLPFPIDLENMVIFFYPARQNERHGKLTFRLDNVEEEDKETSSFDDR